MRMVYKILGITVPKAIRDKLTNEGVEFADYWPGERNQAVPHEVTKSTLGLIEHASISELDLLRTRRKAKEVSGPSEAELQYLLTQSQSEVSTLIEMKRKYVEEISQLKVKVLKWQRKHQDMKRLISSMTRKNEEDYENVKLMFLTKKSKLVTIINELKGKLNRINKTTDAELKLKETLIQR